MTQKYFDLGSRSDRVELMPSVVHLANSNTPFRLLKHFLMQFAGFSATTNPVKNSRPGTYGNPIMAITGRRSAIIPRS